MTRLNSQERSESFTKIKQGPKDAFTDFLQELTLAVNGIISDSDLRKILITEIILKMLI